VDGRTVEQYISGGFADDLATRYRPTTAPQSNGHAWHLQVGPTLFHSGAMSTKAKGLLEIQKEGKLIMNPADAERLGIAEGDHVQLRSAAGEATVPVTMLGRIPAGTLFYPESFREAVASLLAVTPDPVTGVPYNKQITVTVEKVGAVGPGGERVPVAPSNATGDGPPSATMEGGT